MQLQRLELDIPSGDNVRGLTFVLRSEDNSAWWRDGKYLKIALDDRVVSVACFST